MQSSSLSIVREKKLREENEKIENKNKESDKRCVDICELGDFSQHKSWFNTTLMMVVYLYIFVCSLSPIFSVLHCIFKWIYSNLLYFSILFHYQDIILSVVYWVFSVINVSLNAWCRSYILVALTIILIQL